MLNTQNEPTVVINCRYCYAGTYLFKGFDRRVMLYDDTPCQTVYHNIIIIIGTYKATTE